MNLDLVLNNEVKYFLCYMAFQKISGEQNWGERMFEKSKGIA